MKRITSLLLVLLTLLGMFGMFTACSESPTRDDIEYVPYVIDEDEDLSVPTSPSQDDPQPTDAQKPSAPTDATTTTVVTSTTVTTATTTTTTATTTKKTKKTTTTTTTAAPVIDKDGVYTHKDDVALYIHTYGTLPKNFITKKEAQALGWSGGSLERYAPGKCIGGSSFGNYEGRLPKKKGRYYTECDIDTLGKSSRGAKRIVFSNDGLIYYTDDHYETFTLLYGEE